MNEILLASSYDGMEDDLRQCVKDDDFRVWAQNYGPLLLNIIRELEKENLKNLSDLTEAQILQEKNSLIRSTLTKSISVLLENNDGICVSVDEQKYLVLKQDDNIKILESNIDIAENKLVRFET